MTDCAICQLPLRGQQSIGGIPVNDCLRCGRWQVVPPRRIETTLGQQLAGPLESRRRSNLSHTVRRQQRDASIVGVPLDDLPSWGLEKTLPSPAEMANDLITWVGGQQPSHSRSVAAEQLALEAWLGLAISTEHPTRELSWLLTAPEVTRFVEQTEKASAQLRLRLTWPGWERFGELQRNAERSNMAFMAMKFGDTELDRVFASCFRPAVRDTGFDLRLLTDGQGAGCIDDQLRVSLRTSRFVLADLTYQNPGAYWEGGFAEGLGKPVIYSCRQAEWSVQKTHFDTNHLVTVIWNPDDLPSAALQLKAIVRASLPTEAAMIDP
jgi:hypothetical protein